MEEVLFSIRKDGECLGYISQNKDIYSKVTYITEGFIGENTYESLQDLIYGLQGFNIAIDNFYN